MDRDVPPSIPSSSGRSQEILGAVRSGLLVDPIRGDRPDLLGKTWNELMALGRGHVRRGRFAAAMAVFQRALKSKPNHPLSRSYVGLCHAELDAGSVEALPLCRRAAREMRHPEVLVNLARVYLIQGDRRQTIDALREATILAPELPSLLALSRRVRTRKPPVIPFLSRDHRLNVALGRLLTRWGLR